MFPFTRATHFGVTLLLTHPHLWKVRLGFQVQLLEPASAARAPAAPAAASAASHAEAAEAGAAASAASEARGISTASISTSREICAHLALAG